MRILFALHEMGTLDHAIALKSQILKSQCQVSHALLTDDVALPDWARGAFPREHELSSKLAYDSRDSFDAVWFQEPYDELRPSGWTSDKIRTKVVYSGYYVSLIDWHRGTYGLNFYKNCDFVMASSPFARHLFESSSTGPAKAAWTGDPLLYEIQSGYTNRATRLSAPTTFLWSSHWSDTWVDGRRGFSRWRETVGPLLKYFSSHPNAHLIIRGHPHLETTGETDTSYFDDLETLSSLPNVQTSDQSMSTDIGRSDALICDGGSILAYFGATAKPIGFIQLGNDAPPFNAAGRALVSSLSILDSDIRIANWLADVELRPEAFLESGLSTKDLVSQLFPVKRESPGKQLVDFLGASAQK